MYCGALLVVVPRVRDLWDGGYTPEKVAFLFIFNENDAAVTQLFYVQRHYGRSSIICLSSGTHSHTHTHTHTHTSTKRWNFGIKLYTTDLADSIGDETRFGRRGLVSSSRMVQNLVPLASLSPVSHTASLIFSPVYSVISSIHLFAYRQIFFQWHILVQCPVCPSPDNCIFLTTCPTLCLFMLYNSCLFSFGPCRTHSLCFTKCPNVFQLPNISRRNSA